MILTLLWKWLRDLWRDAHPGPALEGDAALGIGDRTAGQTRSSAVFEGDGPQPAE
jgi:hypothetical protein